MPLLHCGWIVEVICTNTTVIGGPKRLSLKVLMEKFGKQTPGPFFLLSLLQNRPICMPFTSQKWKWMLTLYISGVFGGRVWASRIACRPTGEHTRPQKEYVQVQSSSRDFPCRCLCCGERWQCRWFNGDYRSRRKCLSCDPHGGSPLHTTAGRCGSEQEETRDAWMTGDDWLWRRRKGYRRIIYEVCGFLFYFFCFFLL